MKSRNKREGRYAGFVHMNSKNNKKHHAHCGKIDFGISLRLWARIKKHEEKQ